MMVKILGCLSLSNCQMFFLSMAFDKLIASREGLDAADDEPLSSLYWSPYAG